MSAAAPLAAARDHAPGLEHAFAFVPTEGRETLTSIRGDIPSFLRGTYYVNGPARFGRGEQAYGHWLDGDGMVMALKLHDQGATLTRKFVRSHKWSEEEALGRSIYRGFGTAFEGDALLRGILLASPVNVSVYPVGERLVAFGEQGLPWELDPETLDTLGEFTFDRRLNPLSPFSAHPHFSDDGSELFNFGVSFASRQPTLNLYRFQVGGGMVYRKRLPIDHPAMVHDFMVGPRHMIFHMGPHVLDMEIFARGGGSIMDALSWRPELGSRLLFVDRESGEKAGETEIPTGYCLHLISSFVADDGSLTLDILEMDQPVYDQYHLPDRFFEDARVARPTRYLLHPETFELRQRVVLNDPCMCDFPTTDPRRLSQDYESFWVLGIADSHEPGRKFFNQVVRYSWTAGGRAGLWRAPSGCYLGGEPVFVPDPQAPGGCQGGGAVICQLFDSDAKESRFLIFDGLNLEAGPRAELTLNQPVHLGFHATFQPA